MVRSARLGNVSGFPGGGSPGGGSFWLIGIAVMVKRTGVYQTSEDSGVGLWALLGDEEALTEVWERALGRRRAPGLIYSTSR